MPAPDAFDALLGSAFSGQQSAPAPVAQSATPAQSDPFGDLLTSAFSAPPKAQAANTPAPAAPPTLGQQLVAPFQAAASLGTQALAPAAASIENIVRGEPGPENYDKRRAEWVYTPTNPVAQMDIKAATYLPNKVLGPLSNWVGTIANEKSGGAVSKTAAQDAFNTALMGLPGMFGRAGAAAAAPEQAAASQALAAGAKLTPTQAGGGLVSRTLEGIGGSAKLERSLSQANAPWVDQQALSAIGAKGLDPEDLQQAAQPALQVYKAARTAGTVKLQPSDFAAVKTSGTLKNDAVQGLIDHYSQMGSIDANDLVTDLQQLRADGFANKRAPYAPAQNALGRAQLAASQGLESALDRHLSAMDNAPLSVDDLRQARTQLAKISDVEDAIRNGHVSPKLIAKAGEKKPLSGGLANVANAYSNFPRSFQDLNAIRHSAPAGFADLLVGGGLLDLLHSTGMAGHGLPAGAGLLGVAARPAIRGLLSSGLYQRALARPPFLPQAGALTNAGLLGPLLNQQQPHGLLP